MNVDTQDLQERSLEAIQEVLLVLKVSPDIPDHLESKEKEDHKV